MRPVPPRSPAFLVEKAEKLLVQLHNPKHLCPEWRSAVMTLLEYIGAVDFYDDVLYGDLAAATAACHEILASHPEVPRLQWQKKAQV
jgi:hypothetical protein